MDITDVPVLLPLEHETISASGRSSDLFPSPDVLPILVRTVDLMSVG